MDIKEIENLLRSNLTPDASEEKPNPKCSVRFKVKKHNGARLSTYETDDQVDIYINPSKIRSQNTLDHTIEQCMEVLTL